MDYEKKYKEAIELAKKLNIDEAYASQGALIKSIFPELAENEDERVKKLITDSIFYLYGVGAEYEDVINYIDKLEKQKEQKPAEWSEEDDYFINMLILHFNYLIDKGGDSVETYKSYREQLKSLRFDIKNRGNFPKSNTNSPSWKPSEEQMYALKNVVETYRQRHNVSVGGDYIFIGVESLYNDLKKL